jgi:hypothetical protein
MMKAGWPLGSQIGTENMFQKEGLKKRKFINY